jgi:hypothetical protein
VHSSRTVLFASLILSLASPSLAHAQGEIAASSNWECGFPPTLPNEGFISVSASGWRAPGMGVPYQWTCAAVRANGTLVMWSGANNDRGAPWTPPDTDIVAVSVQISGLNTLILRRNGSIWTSNPPPGPNSGFVAVSSSTHHCLALRDDGSIVAWGDNTYGQCNVPEPNEGYVAIEAASSVIGNYGYSLAINSEGSVIAWGSNNTGQLDVPPPNTGFIAISASAEYAAGVKADGSAVIWGSCQPNCDPVVPKSDIIGVATESPGQSLPRTMFVCLDGSILGWGGPGPNVGFVAAAMGDEHAIAIRGRPSSSVQTSPTMSSTAISVFPNPFSLRTAVTGPAKDITVYAPTGRLVRALGTRMEWDGYDEHGQRVPPGVYFLLVNSPQGQRSLRVTRLR